MPLFKSRSSDKRTHGKSTSSSSPAQEKAGAFAFNFRPPSSFAELLSLQNVSFFNRANSNASGASSRSSSVHSNKKNDRSPSPHSTPASRAEALLDGLARLAGHGSTDPEITVARQKVLDAQRAEDAAEKARKEATNLVKHAKLEVDRLEREATAHATRARVKQAQLKVVSDSAKSLGRRK